jgi:hypothetical protein
METHSPHVIRTSFAYITISYESPPPPTLVVVVKTAKRCIKDKRTSRSFVLTQSARYIISNLGCHSNEQRSFDRSCSHLSGANPPLSCQIRFVLITTLTTVSDFDTWHRFDRRLVPTRFVDSIDYFTLSVLIRLNPS